MSQGCHVAFSHTIPGLSSTYWLLHEHCSVQKEDSPTAATKEKPIISPDFSKDCRIEGMCRVFYKKI